MTYDVIIIGAGPGGIFSAYELMQRRPEWKVAVLEAGKAALSHRRRQGEVLHSLQDLRHYERLRRRRRIFRRQI
mgnify:CR=1 FL=1